MNRPAWLKDAVFYEIYPSSFFDSNADGVGDIDGIRQKLSYVKELGCNALWLNPCFDSPFKDGGYDVRDYKLVAPRYGTNEDIFALFREAHALGIRVVPWTVDRDEDILRMKDCRVDAIISNYPDRLINNLRKQ